MKTERLESGQITGAAATRRAAEILRAGGLVAFPTETVYGLGANALDAMAVAKIFTAKGRPAWDPLIVHVEGRPMLEKVAVLKPELKDTAEELMLAFWPGPLTLLLPRTAELPFAVTAARTLVAVRMPKHSVARELIRLAGVPVAAPSANRFGHTSPTTAAHVLRDLDGRIEAVLDGGPATVGLESTVFDVGTRTIYRPGAVTAEMIEQVLGDKVQLSSEAAIDPAPSDDLTTLPSPGMAMRHYAPDAKLVLVEGQGALREEVAKYPKAEVGVMLPDGWDPAGASAVFRWGPWDDADTLARLLYLGLRVLDDRGVKVIVCPTPEMGGIGAALRDRLKKAAK
ncbi:MAG TPA: L-threonylcarbamoyladenylate synthase [Acidobacteriaceae bacterium]|nr:L-threonylcarbamoyladenylate synthase [Acidobacteriaceae bacterium]